MKKLIGLIMIMVLILPMVVSAQEINNQELLRDRILELNPLRSGADFSMLADNSNRDTQEGLFSVQDEHGTAHFFRGTHDLNNNVIFAGHQWKILRIEGNGNIRLIYNGECPNNECEINGIRWNDTIEDFWSGVIGGYEATGNVMVGTSRYNFQGHQTNHVRYVGYKFGSEEGTFEEQHANTYNSTIKIFIDNWFLNNINGEHRGLVANNTVFCNDRSIYYEFLGENFSEISFGAWGRLFDNSEPILTCPRSEDQLLLPIGLLTSDEAVMSGLSMDPIDNGAQFKNPHGFLASGLTSDINTHFWTMTPHEFNEFPDPYHTGRGTVRMNVITGSGVVIVMAGTDSTLGVRPVLSLNSNVTATGDGSSENPFVIDGLYEGRVEDDYNGEGGDGQNNDETQTEDGSVIQTSDGSLLILYSALTIIACTILIKQFKHKKVKL